MLDTPVWETILYDLNNQPTMDISKLVDLDLELKLNDVSTVQFDIDLRKFEQLCADISVNPRNILYPSRTEVKIYRNGKSFFGGIIAIANSSYGQVNATLMVTADSYIQYFAKRLLKKNYTGTDRSDIAWNAIETVQSVPYGDLGVTRGITAPTHPSDLTADYRDVKSIIQLYTYAQPVTYDYEITPEKVFNTYLRLGSDRPEYPLVYPQNIVSIEIPRSSDTLYNKVIGIGSGIGEERLQTIKENTGSQINNRVQEKKELYSSVVVQQTLEENTQGFLDESTEVLVLPKVTIQTGAIDLDVVRVGDSLPVKFLGSAYNNDIDGMFRIYGMNIKVSKESFETITLDFYKPNAGGGTEDDL